MDPLQQGDSSVDVQSRCARWRAVLQDLSVCDAIGSVALHGDCEVVGAVASGFDLNIRSCDGGQGSICGTSSQVFDLVHQIDCDLLQREPIVVGVGDADIHWNGHIEARA